jgi:hypothetical protein
MKYQQEDFLNMLYTETAVCTKFQTTWSTNTVFSQSQTLLAGKLPLIEANRDAQMTTSKGITAEKNAKRALAVDKALFLVNRMQSYATVTGNNDLLESIRFNSSKLNKCRDTEVVGYCDNIAAKATANVANLANYGVTAVLITDFQTAVAAYAAYIAKPRTVTTVTKNATENLAILFKEANDILTKRLDLDIEVFKTTKPDFYSQYQSARQIISSSGSATAVKGITKAKENGELLKNVTLTFSFIENGTLKAAVTSTNKDVVKKSADKGKFPIANLAEGTYIVTVHKIGFKDQTITITVAKGETTDLVIELEKA